MAISSDTNINAAFKEKIITMYIEELGAPGRDTLFLTMRAPIQLRVSDLAKQLKTNKKNADWAEYRSYDFQAEEHVKIFNRALKLMSAEEREGANFRQVRTLLGDWHGLTDEACKRATLRI